MKKRVLLFFKNLDNIIAASALVVIIAITVLGVFLRYVMNDPLKWTEEVSVGLFVWFIFIGASCSMKKGHHVSIDYFVDKFPPSIRKIVQIGMDIITILTLIILIYLGTKLSFSRAAMLKITPILKVPYTYIDLAVPVGGVLMLYHMIKRLFIRKKEAAE